MRREIVSRTLGKTDVELSALGFGAASLGNLYQAISNNQARETLQAAVDCGLTYIDTAPFYGYGLSERRVGDFLRSQGQDSFVLSTKVGRFLKPDVTADTNRIRDGFASPMPFRPEYDYSYDGIMRSYEDSLQRLGLGRIDILLVHDIGVQTHGADNGRHFQDLEMGGYRALDELRKSGAVGAIGLGVNEWEICEQAMEIGQFDCFLLAGRYTLLEQEPFESFFPKCKAHGASIIVGGAYNSGILATGTKSGNVMHYNYEPATTEIISRVQCIERVCETYNVTLAAAALQFPLAHEIVASVIPGLGKVKRVEQTIALYHEDIPVEFWQTLKDEGILPQNVPVPTGRR
ncbi:MAG: aldo/keto reductase [Robiginitomaculum sp.]